MLLITGANGFIGRNLTKRLIKEGYSLRLLTRDMEKSKKLFPKAELIKGDITDRESLKKAVKGVSKVIHLAGIVSYTLPKSELIRINTHGTKMILEASKNVNKFLHASSVAVIGNIEGRVDENYECKPVTQYGKSKYEAEKLVLNSGLNNVCLRIAPVYGLGSDIWIKVMKMIDKGFPIPNVDRMMHVVHVDDVSQAFVKSLRKGSGVYLIADNNPMKIKKFTGMISQYLGKKQKVWPLWLVYLLSKTANMKKEFDAFIMNRYYNTTKAKEELGFKPERNLEKELKKMVEWYLKNKK